MQSEALPLNCPRCGRLLQLVATAKASRRVRAEPTQLVELTIYECSVHGAFQLWPGSDLVPVDSRQK